MRGIAGVQRAGGFTVVELVVVLALVGILSAVALARFVDGDPIAARRAGSEVLAAARAAQQLALANADGAVTLQVMPTSPGLDIQVQLLPPVGALRTLHRATVGDLRDDLVIRTGMDSTPLGTATLVLGYDALGGIAAATLGAAPLAAGAGVELASGGWRGCVHGSGLATAAACP